ARSLGQSMRILKAEAKGLKDDDKDATGTNGHAPAPKQLPESSTDSTADQN
ncbi:MAG: hypothetical protein QOD70_1796, partial [Frankiales bacterium]|nr:hypothetical protein [Frankiales bacterium]